MIKHTDGLPRNGYTLPEIIMQLQVDPSWLYLVVAEKGSSNGQASTMFHFHDYYSRECEYHRSAIGVYIDYICLYPMLPNQSFFCQPCPLRFGCCLTLCYLHTTLKCLVEVVWEGYLERASQF